MTGAEALLKHAAAVKDKPFAASFARLPLRFRSSRAPGLRMQVHVATTGPEPGNWLISVDDDNCRVFVGSVATPDARLFTSSDIGHSILHGELPLDEALTAGLLDYDGDPVALRRFSECFEFGGRHDGQD
jgi:hypothetical protein